MKTFPDRKEKHQFKYLKLIQQHNPSITVHPHAKWYLLSNKSIAGYNGHRLGLPIDVQQREGFPGATRRSCWRAWFSFPPLMHTAAYLTTWSVAFQPPAVPGHYSSLHTSITLFTPSAASPLHAPPTPQRPMTPCQGWSQSHQCYIIDLLCLFS